MTASTRAVHIDALRGLAVLLMVLVHAAATWEPSLSGGFLLLGVIVSAGGGLAAPLFVALLGWGLAQRELTIRQRCWRAGCLVACQVIVNVSAPHLFDPFTPGVLSLLGLAILTEPWWGRLVRSDGRAVRRFTTTFVAVIVLSVLTESLQGPSDWAHRVAYDSFPVWVNHSVFTGLYPFFPWIVFACFGMTVAHLSVSQRYTFFRNITVIGMATSATILVQSQLADRPWALPTGEASLTFFPANAPFLIAAMTGVAMLWWVAERGVNDRCTVACRSSIAHRVRVALHTVRSVPRGGCRPWVVCHIDRCGRRSVHHRVDRPGNLACSACTSSHD